ncbi:MAG: glycosyltransferase [Lachnospiraceae bacterium]|nr:glycosyltransferase [Lachnospiraceae bacterium]
MKLSIIVPVYNMSADGRLSYCLDSLLAQSLKQEYEVIAVDDCSTDDSFSVLKDYEKRYPGRVTALHSEVNHHQGGAKNIGLARARGEWIGFIDSDDWIIPEYYELLLDKAEETGADMVGCDYCFTEEHSFKPGRQVSSNNAGQTGIMDHEKYKKLLLETGSLVVKVYRRELILQDYVPGSRSKVDVFPEDIFYEDNAVSNSWMLRCRHFEYIPEAMYFYYQHDASTVHTVSLKNLKDRMEAGRMILDNAKEEGYYEEYKNELDYQFITLFYKNTLFSAMPKKTGLQKGCFAFIKGLSKEVKELLPDFQENPYYKERTDAEEKKLMKLQMKSDLLFYVYYRLLWFYRGLRNG